MTYDIKDAETRERETKMSNFNNPTMKDENDQTTIRRYTHSPMTIEHNGIKASIKANGKIIISKVANVLANGDVEIDEVEIPASLIFKLATLLKATRTVQYVALGETKQ